MHSLAALVLALAGSTYAQQTAWGQCGGTGWTGPTTCIAGWTPWYSQCLQGTATTSTSSPATSKSASKSSTSLSSTTKLATSSTTLSTAKTTGTSSSKSSSTTAVTAVPSSTTSSAPTGSPGSGPGTTLTSGWFWIRAVEDPNFHKYLQTNPEYSTGTAILDDYTTAGQFNIINGQLVELVTGGNLYAVVQPATSSTATMLSMVFSKTQNTYGTFAFQGDAVTWSIPSISRPNVAAWLVCANQQLFINLGSYDYMTPAGCADETIHYYNGATAVDK